MYNIARFRRILLFQCNNQFDRFNNLIATLRVQMNRRSESGRATTPKRRFKETIYCSQGKPLR